MAYAASVVSSSIKDATVRDIITTNKFIKILKSKNVVLSFPKIDDISKAVLICSSDVSFVNLKCGGLQDGLLVFLEESDKRCIYPSSLAAPKIEAGCQKHTDS